MFCIQRVSNIVFTVSELHRCFRAAIIVVESMNANKRSEVIWNIQRANQVDHTRHQYIPSTMLFRGIGGSSAAT